MSAMTVELMWSLIASDITLEERQRLHNALFDAVEWQKYLVMYKAVSYNEHYKALYWRKNAFDLYDPELIKVMNEAEGNAD